MAAYSASKAGVIALTKSAGKELAQSGILVNCVVPAVFDAGLTHAATEEDRELFASRVPMGRMGRPEELAELVSWLASERCSFSTGAAFDLSGGRAVYCPAVTPSRGPARLQKPVEPAERARVVQQAGGRLAVVAGALRRG